VGLFDFFKKDKGKEVFQENADANERAEAIRREIKRLGLPGDITVEVEGSRVKVGGNVPDEATRQKLAMIVGNVRHIDSVDDSALAGGQQGGQQQPKTYEVQSGDTLSSIAKTQYGDANAYNRIFTANQPMLKDPDEIYPGQVLLIPESTTASA
jgi:nucleoid-associated protein YgaU